MGGAKSCKRHDLGVHVVAENRSKLYGSCHVIAHNLNGHTNTRITHTMIFGIPIVLVLRARVPFCHRPQNDGNIFAEMIIFWPGQDTSINGTW